MQQVVDRHPSKDGKHLLGILDEGMARNLRWQCHAVQGKVNRWLHLLVEGIGLGKPVTMYCARHSWATIAREKHVPMSVISDGMGHHSEKTTRIYLRGIDTAEIDKCNDLLIGEILKDGTYASPAFPQSSSPLPSSSSSMPSPMTSRGSALKGSRY